MTLSYITIVYNPTSFYHTFLLHHQAVEMVLYNVVYYLCISLLFGHTDDRLIVFCLRVCSVYRVYLAHKYSSNDYTQGSVLCHKESLINFIMWKLILYLEFPAPIYLGNCKRDQHFYHITRGICVISFNYSDYIQ